MTRDELERRFWLGLRDLGLDRKQAAVNVIENWLDAADLYATHTGGITAERRAALDEATRETSNEERAIGQQARRGREADRRAS